MSDYSFRTCDGNTRVDHVDAPKSMVTFEAPTVRELDLCTISDMHKDAHGFRPNMARYNAMATGELHSEMVTLAGQVQASIDEEAQSEAVAVRKLTDTMHDMVETHGINRADALRWLAQADEVRFDNQQDILYFLHLNNVHSIEACTVFEDIIHGEM